MHNESHPLAGKTTTINGKNFYLEDWWDRISGGRSWMDMQGNPACIIYGLRAATVGLPLDNEVVYGKCDSGLGNLLHISELD